MTKGATGAMAKKDFGRDAALRQLLRLLWDEGWDNTIFMLEARDDGSLSPWLIGFQVSRAGIVLGAEQIADGGAGSVVVKAESQDQPGLRVMEERFTCLEILLNRRIIPRVVSLLEKLQPSG